MPPIHHHKRAELAVADDCERLFFLYRLLDIILLLFDGFSPYIIPLASSTVKVIRNQWIKNG